MTVVTEDVRNDYENEGNMYVVCRTLTEKLNNQSHVTTAETQGCMMLKSLTLASVVKSLVV